MEATIDRPIIQDQADIRDYDHLNGWRGGLIALAQLGMDILGSQGPVVAGFAATADSPADLSFTLGAGDIYQMADIDATAYGSLSADTAEILQQGITGSQKVTLTTAGLSSGQSRWALVQAAFSQTDEIPSDDPNGGILPYLNTSNPAGAPWSGPNNDGAAQNTRRLGAVTVDVVYGAVATTGSEVPPTPTSGYAPLYLVDLAYGQTQIQQSQILVAGPSIGTGVPSNYEQAPFLAGLLNSHHGGIAGQAPQIKASEMAPATISNIGVDSGSTANVYVVNSQLQFPASASLVDRQRLIFYTTRANTGAADLQYGANAADPIERSDGSAVQAGDIISGLNQVMWNAGASAWVVIGLSLSQILAATNALYVLASAFTGSNQDLASSGYQKLPGGLILQWGSGTLPASGTVTSHVAVTFPNAFPTAALIVVGNCLGGANSTLGCQPTFGTPAVSTTGFTANGDTLTGNSGTPVVFNQGVNFYWSALGY